MLNKDQDYTVHVRLVKRTAGTLALATIAIIIARIILADIESIAFTIANTVIVSYLCVFILTDRVFPASTGAWIIVLVSWLGLTAGGYVAGGLDGPVIVAFPLLPLVATMLINHRAALIAGFMAIASIVFYFTFDIGDQLKHLSNLNRIESNIMRGEWLIFTLFIISAIGWYYGRKQDSQTSLLKSQADTDYLTQIANRRLLTKSLEHEYARNRRGDGWLTLLMIDIDHFKKLNDMHGHLSGDNCLIQIAGKIRQYCRRAGDLVGRYGGEEFMVILPNTSPEEARNLAELIRIAIFDLKIPINKQGHPSHVTVTIGCNSVHGSEDVGSEQMIKTADELLYQGKAAGRNIVVSNSRMLPEPVSQRAQS